jgi:hypothetical protein
VPQQALIVLLNALLAAGVEAPGFVPRNMFHRDGHLCVIDWEDASFAAPSAAPSDLTVMKWDIAWSDVYRIDPRVRHTITVRRKDEPPDTFERAFLDLMGVGLVPAEARTRGMELTLRSELYVRGVEGITAAELGHLVDEILPARHSVLYTSVTAHLRAVGGEPAYAKFLTGFWKDVHSRAAIGRRATRTNGLHVNLLLFLCSAADRCLAPWRSDTASLDELRNALSELAPHGGWTAACRRAELAEALLVRICDLVVSALGLTDIELILRGSLAQGAVTYCSDLDFELSGPRFPSGHRGAERLVLDILAACGLEAEASEGRPTEADLYDQRSGLTRDVHEWMELRRPGSDLHDPGWLRHIFAPTMTQLVYTDSEYERAGRRNSAKFAWFEARTLLARLAFRYAQGPPPVIIWRQLNLVDKVIDGVRANELRDIVMIALDLRERNGQDLAQISALQRRIDELCRQVSLPGAGTDRN